MWIMVSGQYVGDVKHECFVNGYNRDCYRRLSDEQLAKYEEASKALGQAFRDNKVKFQEMKEDLANRLGTPGVDIPVSDDILTDMDNKSRIIYWNVIKEILAEHGFTDPKKPGYHGMYELKKNLRLLLERAEVAHKTLQEDATIENVYVEDRIDFFEYMRGLINDAEAAWKDALANPEEIGQ